MKGVVMTDRLRVHKIELGPFSPLAQARLEIMGLAHVPELATQCMLGGPTPPEMEEENARRLKERRRRELAIIEKHGVADEYLKPLLEEEKRLETKLVGVREQITELQVIQKK